MNAHDSFRRTGEFIKNSPTLKMVSMGILILILLIPKSMVSDLTYERQSRREGVVKEINDKWGGKQEVTGPFITVPFKTYYKEFEALKYHINHLHILPETLNIQGKVDPNIRYRGIFEAVLYNTQLNISGHFSMPDLENSGIDPENVLWDQASMNLGITDMRGIQENINITFNEQTYPVNPGVKRPDLTESGVSCQVPFLRTQQEQPFSLDVNLNGSQELKFVPVGKETNVNVSSPWQSPSFQGAFLPTKRNITEDGFDASWKVLHLNRNFPQMWQDDQFRVYPSAFGLELLITNDIYQKSTRISKYAIMFIVFTFTALFFSEIISRRRMHPIQYLLIGLAIVLFYVLLLSISEHMNFNLAYIISSLSITAMISGYCLGITGNRTFTSVVGSLLVVLYTYLYVVLQLEDYSLLMGSIGLFMILGTIMYITRKIDWYALGGSEPPPQPSSRTSSRGGGE